MLETKFLNKALAQNHLRKILGATDWVTCQLRFHFKLDNLPIKFSFLKIFVYISIISGPSLYFFCVADRGRVAEIIENHNYWQPPLTQASK